MMAASIKKFLSPSGFDGPAPESTSRLPTALFMALAFAALPLLLHAWDADRGMSLAFLPAVWCEWKIARPADTIDKRLLVIAIFAMILSACFAEHSARAFVMISAVGWVLAGASVARNLATCATAVRLVMAGIVVGAIVGFFMVRLGVGAGGMFFPTYWSARLFGAHQFAGALASLGILVAAPPARTTFRLLAACAALICWTGLAWSGGRAAALGLSVALVLWFWKSSPIERRRLASWTPLLAALALVVSYSLGAPYRQLGWWDAIQRTTQATTLAEVSSERTVFWSATLTHAFSSPFIGHGADSYLYIRPAQNGNQPHNVLVQWLLEYGLLGAVPLVLLVWRGIAGLFAKKPESETQVRPLGIWACASLGGSAVYGLFDGVFYHMIIFMPVAAFAGFALGQRTAPTTDSRDSYYKPAWRPLLLCALALLLLHNWLCLMLIKGRNIAPDSPPALALRVFPSTSYALRNWIDRWRFTHPQAVMPWIKWAQENATDQGAYHVYAAQLHIWNKDYAAAEREMLTCLDKVQVSERADVLAVIDTVRTLAAKSAVKKPSPATPALPGPARQEP